MKKALILILAFALLLCSTALADSVKAVANPTYVRTGPGLDYKIFDSLTPNTYHEWGGDVVYDNRGVAWYSVYYGPNGTFGWVSSLHANMVSSWGDGDSRNGAYSNGTSVYATGDVNVRTGPAHAVSLGHRRTQLASPRMDLPESESGDLCPDRCKRPGRR